LFILRPVLNNKQKRWFGELPNRIFAGVPPSYFNEVSYFIKRVSNILTFFKAAESDDKANMLTEKITEPARSYLLWFIEVLLDVSFFGDVNKMTCASLGNNTFTTI